MVCIAREESSKAVFKAITVMKAVALAAKAATMKAMKAATMKAMKAAVTNRQHLFRTVFGYCGNGSYGPGHHCGRDRESPSQNWKNSHDNPPVMR